MLYIKGIGNWIFSLKKKEAKFFFPTVMRGQLEVDKSKKMTNRKIYHSAIFVQGVSDTVN